MEASPAASRLREEAAAYSASAQAHTIEDIYALPDGFRAELVNGQLYYMATPTRTHQKINGEMHLAVANYIRAHGGSVKFTFRPSPYFHMKMNLPISNRILRSSAIRPNWKSAAA